MHYLTITVQVGLWSVAGYVAVHIYEDWRHRRKKPTLQHFSNAIRGGKRHAR